MTALTLTIVNRTIADHRVAGDNGDMLSLLVAAQEEGTGFTDEQILD